MIVFNKFVDKGNFPSILKTCKHYTSFQKGYRGSKDNFKPVNILPVFSKILENLLCIQIVLFIDPLLPTILVIIFWNFTVFQDRSDSPQGKQNLISSIANVVYELPHELSNNLRL